MKIAKEYLKFKKDAIFHIFDGSLSNYLQYNNDEKLYCGWTKKIRFTD